jgi:hypothetical protein
MKKNLFWMAVIGLTVMLSAMLTSCSKDDDEGMASELVGNWKSVGYYDNSINGNYYPGITVAPIPDTSETITFKSNGKGVYTANGVEKEFDWEPGEIAVHISIAPSVHNSDNWNYGDREYYVSSTELVIIWSNARQFVYQKGK